LLSIEALNSRGKRVREVRATPRDPNTHREVRISTGTYDESEADRQRRELEAKLLLGLEVLRSNDVIGGPSMSWDDFREQYRTHHLSTIRKSSSIHAESRLDIATRVVQPKTLEDMARPNALSKLRSELASGALSRNRRPRSPFTVKGYMKSLVAALDWAYRRNWLVVEPRIEKFGRLKQQSMKGRPLTEHEFNRMLDCTSPIVGRHAAESWQFLLRGLWESGFRLNEIMNFSWDDSNAIRPVWLDGAFPVISIPGFAQKNGIDETIPMLPGLEELLLSVPTENRTGWIFDPLTIWNPDARKYTHNRLTGDHVGKLISKIGRKADILVRSSEAAKKLYLEWRTLKTKTACSVRIAGRW
jgi:integrase